MTVVLDSVSFRSFCKRGHNGLFKILGGGGGRHVVWACDAQIPRGAHRIQEGANAPPPNEILLWRWRISLKSSCTVIDYYYYYFFALPALLICTPLPLAVLSDSGTSYLYMYGRRQKKVPISRSYNGTGNSVPFPFRSRLISVRLPFLSVFKPFPFCPTGSPSVLVNGPYGVIKHAQLLIAVISAGRLATVQ